MKELLFYLLVVLAVGISAAAFAGESGVAPNVLSIPKGPGSIEGLGEEFEPAANSGTASYGIAIALPEGSGGFKPAVRISYDGGRGNSSLGFGWSVQLPRVQRQTDKGLPVYDSTDTFIYQGNSINEELVQLSDSSFRLKTEGAFIRAAKDGAGWEVRLKNGVIYRLGKTADSRVKDATGTKIFAWNISEMEDTNGNLVTFDWTVNGNQSYISKILYNNYSADAANEILFTYEARPDILTDYRATFPVTTAQRLKKIEVRRGGKLVRSYNLSYDADSPLSRLVKIVLVGSDGVSSMPPLTFDYTDFSPLDRPVIEMSNPPGEGLLAPNNALMDMNGDSLPDLLVAASGDHRYYINEDGVRWADATAMSSSPSYELSQDGVRLADIDGDGLSDLVVARGALGNSYFPGSYNAQWLSSVPFDQNPVGFELEDPETRFVDLNGDRLIDVLRTNATGVSAWIHMGTGSFERSGALPRIDPAQEILFSDPKIQLADLNGDGLLDVARLRSGSLIYWASRGYGLFESAISVAGAPTVDDETRLRVADINGDGLADVVYLGISHIRYWLNQSNNTLGAELTISGTPAADPATTSVQFADMNGNGTTDIVWVDVTRGPAGSWRYLDLIGDQFPGLITKVDNGLGKSVTIEYESSTEQMVRAALDGNAWDTTIPFPMPVIRLITVDDGLGTQMTTEYSYRDGYYDGHEREFFGFASGTKTEYGDASIEDLLSVWTFDVGRTFEALKGRILSEEYRSAGGTLFTRSDNIWEMRTLAAGTDGRQIVLPLLATTSSAVFEGTSSPRYTRRDLDYDIFGNVTDDLDHGEVTSATDDGSMPSGNDEVFVHRDYATNLTNWILDRVSLERISDGSGTKLAETKNYYDGAVFVGMPLGQADKGNLARQDKWLRTEDRFVSVARNRRDNWGNVTAILDANDGRREIFYDSASHTYPVRERIFTGTDALDFVAEYDEVFGKVAVFTDINGGATSFRYDAFGRPVSVVKPGDSAEFPTAEYAYTVSAPLSVITIKAREVSGTAATLDSYRYVDGLGRTRSEIGEDEGGTFIVTKAARFNTRGKESFVADPFRCGPPSSDCLVFGDALASKTGTVKTYDAMGRVVKAENPDGTYSSAEYRPLEERLYDENGTPAVRHYDGHEKITFISLKNGDEEVATSFSYDALGNIISVTDPAGNKRTIDYDGLGRMVSLTDPNAGHRSYIYDDAGNLIEKQKPDGKAVKFKYEITTNRILAKNLAATADDDTWDVNYHYDAASPDFEAGPVKGRLSWVEDGAGKEYFRYDSRGRVTAKRRTAGSESYDFAFEFDAMDRLTGMTYPDGKSVAQTYNERGTIKSIGNYLVGRSYNASGQVASETMGEGIVKNYSYDPRHRVSDISVMNASGDTLQSFHYDLDPAGNILQIKDLRDVEADKLQTQSFTYDGLYRLTRSETPAGSISWVYDSIGNILQRSSTLPDTRLNAEAIRYGENGAGPYAMTSADDKRFEYDVNGNLVKMPGQSLEYDAEDKLTKVAKEDGTTVEMVYAHDNMRKIKRVTKTDGTISETVYVDPNYEVRGDKKYKYIWADGKRIARDDE